MLMFSGVASKLAEGLACASVWGSTTRGSAGSSRASCEGGGGLNGENSASITEQTRTSSRPRLHPNRLQGCTSEPVGGPTGSHYQLHARTVYLHITVQCVGIRLQTKAGATAVKHPSPLLTGGGLRVPQGRALAHPPAPHRAFRRINSPFRSGAGCLPSLLKIPPHS